MGKAVQVTFGGKTVVASFDKSATRDGKGRWTAELPAMTANRTSQSLTVNGTNTIEIKDVLIGEVWLCSGQSNMEWTVASSTNAAAEIAAAEYPLIRQIKVPKVQSTVPLDDIAAQWQVCSPETAGGFTPGGHFMARRLHKELNVPIGLVNSS